MKNQIVAVFIGLLVVLGIFFKFADNSTILEITGVNLDKKEHVVTSNEKLENVSLPVLNNNSIQTSSSTTNITVGIPKGAVKTLGVIEIGATGFNSFIIKVDKENNWLLQDKQFGESLAYEGFATVDDVKKGLRKYLSEMFNKGVSGKNMHFVISSGALKNPKTELIAKAISSEGYVVNRVTAEQEGILALKASLPKEYYEDGFSVDMGSGNTKISWVENNKIKTFETFGAKYYQDEISDEKALSDIQNILNKIPENKRQYCFIIGGVPFQLAKETRTNDERFTILNKPSFYNAGKDVKLHSGLILYRAIYNTGAEPVFDWDANFTIGFLLNLNK